MCITLGERPVSGGPAARSESSFCGEPLNMGPGSSSKDSQHIPLTSAVLALYNIPLIAKGDGRKLVFGGEQVYNLLTKLKAWRRERGVSETNAIDREASGHGGEDG